MQQKPLKLLLCKKNQEMHYEIKDLDLIIKKFNYHSFCYKEFNRGYSAKCRADTLTNSEKLTYEKTTRSKRTFDIKTVEEFIEIHVI